MKWIVILLIALPLLMGCGARTVRQEQFSADGKIHEWEAQPAGAEWTVSIWYDVHNTGIAEITRYNVHVTIDVEGSKTVIADCWGPSATAKDYRAKKVSKPIAPNDTGRCVIVLDIPYKPIRLAIKLEELK